MVEFYSIYEPMHFSVCNMSVFETLFRD